MTPTQAQEVRVSLPWPEKVLSPNGRSHWTRKAKATKNARHDAAWATRSVFRLPPKWDSVAVRFEFRPPDQRRRDRDNLIASMKAATDGIADALGIDDSKFIATYSMGAPVKGGAVEVTIARGT